MKKYDVAVIGGGASGLTVAYTAVGFKKSVVLIDKHKPGGDCTWYGCVPSKALIHEANQIFNAKKYADFEVDTEAVMSKVRETREKVYTHESIEVLEKDGIDFLGGVASFKSEYVLQIGDELVKAKHIFICTGSQPIIPNIQGIKDVDYLTNESFFELTKLPESVIVLGGGAIGVELSQAMNRLGVKVSLVEKSDVILPKEEKELAQLLQARLIEEGINIYTSFEAVSMTQDEYGVKMKLKNNSHEISVTGQRVLLALGRKASIKSLNLEAVGIELDNQTVKVNEFLQTSLAHVYAVGDVSGGFMFSHMANVEGILATQNSIFPIKRKINYKDVSWCTFTTPELALAGLTEQQARDQFGNKIRVYRQSYENLDRAMTDEATLGVVKVILDQRGFVLGASVLGERAGELISQIQIIKTTKLNFAKLATVIHPYPTYAEVLVKIGKRVAVDNLLQKPILKHFKK